MLRLLACAGLWLAFSSNAMAACPRPGETWLAIIIDDLGYARTRGIELATLPAPLTLSIIPGTPYAAELAALGEQWGKELMVHLPMSSAATPVTDPIVLTEGLTEGEFAERITRALAAVPAARGLNNHMGSALTTDPAAMDRLMALLKQQDMYFIDSRTTAETVAAAAAWKAGIPHASRTVFLDHMRGADAVAKRLSLAISKAQKTGAAIAIGHPHRETIEVLQLALPQLPEDVTLVPASHIVACPEAQRLTSIPLDAM